MLLLVMKNLTPLFLWSPCTYDYIVKLLNYHLKWRPRDINVSKGFLKTPTVICDSKPESCEIWNIVSHLVWFSHVFFQIKTPNFIIYME